MEKLLQYFMQETDKKFEGLSEDIQGVQAKLEDLSKFKIEMIASARLTALIVSAFCGFITLTISVWAMKK